MHLSSQVALAAVRSKAVVLLLLTCCLLLLPLWESVMVCCTLLYVPSSFAIILIGKRELIALLCLSSWCLVIVVWLFRVVPWVCLQFVIVVFPDHTHLLFLLHLTASNHVSRFKSTTSIISMKFLSILKCL